MRGQICTSITLLQMEAGQHVLHVVEDGSTGSHLPSHHLQPSLDGSGIHTSRAGPGLGERPVQSFWDLLSMAVSQVEPTLKLYNTYLPPLNSHRAQDGPLNILDEVHKCMQLHRPNVTDDRECGNLEFLCTLNTPSPERMRYFLELCKEKKTAHLRRTLLETQNLLRTSLSFWEGASHQTDRGGWWERAPSEELTSVQANLASPSVGHGGLHRLQS